ncbi:MAG: Ig-like domain-containing protein [Cytophagaceae bacterium]|nr:Ig-like domain-containing protein [Cytophagaceae bacterium]MDW8456448.1 Ig-like domain-containing protein [Cytophagaceae bacterium]
MNDGDVVEVELTSNLSCAVPSVVLSNQIVMTVHANPVLNLSKSDKCGTNDNASISFTLSENKYKYDYSSGLTYTGPMPPFMYQSIIGVNAITGLSNGDYTVRLYDTLTGCYADASINIGLIAAPPLNMSSTPACGSLANGTISFPSTVDTYTYGYSPGLAYTGVIPPVDYTTTIGINTISGLNAGVYTVYLYDPATNCHTEDSIIVNSVSPPNVYTLSGNTNLCMGDTTQMYPTLSGSDVGVLYQLQRNGSDVGLPVSGTGTSIAFPGQSSVGAYAVYAYVSSLPSCSATMSGTLNVVVHPKPVIDSVVTSCSGGAGTGSITVHAKIASGSLRYSITGVTYQSSNIFTNLPNGPFIVYVREATTQCSDTSSLIIMACNNAPLVMNDRQCTTPNTAISGNVLNNDRDLEGHTLKVNPITSSLTSKGGTITIDTAGVYTYIPASGFIGLDSIQYTVCDNGTPAKCTQGYLVVKINSSPVANKDTVSVNQEESLIATVTALSNDTDPDGDMLHCVPQNITLSSGANFTLDSMGIYTYIPATGYYGTEQIVYTACDGCGACDTSIIEIKVIKALPVFIPDGFSPNGDGHHDVFFIEGIDKFKVAVRVYNRWGSLVYINKNYDNSWDGTSNHGLKIGERLPDGTYFIVVEIDGEVYKPKDITLKR